MSDKICSSCKFISAKVVANGAANELIVKCTNGHARIWLFTGGACRDYQPKSINQNKEQ